MARALRGVVLVIHPTIIIRLFPHKKHVVRKKAV
jgi:hypothetical protein